MDAIETNSRDFSGADRDPLVVIDNNGLLGVVAAGELTSSSLDQHLLVRFQNGQEVLVPSRLLIRHEDGRYYLPANVETLLKDKQFSGRFHLSEEVTDDLMQTMADEQALVVPVIEEKVKVQTRTRISGTVEILKTVHERIEVVDLPLHAEEAEVHRVAVNRFVDAPVPVRYEGDTMIIPLLEEVLVVEKRLLLREEVHVKTVRKELHNPQEVVLREERVDVVRIPSPDQGDQLAGAH